MLQLCGGQNISRCLTSAIAITILVLLPLFEDEEFGLRCRPVGPSSGCVGSPAVLW